MLKPIPSAQTSAQTPAQTSVPQAPRHPLRLGQRVKFVRGGKTLWGEVRGRCFANGIFLYDVMYMLPGSKPETTDLRQIAINVEQSHILAQAPKSELIEDAIRPHICEIEP